MSTDFDIFDFILNLPEEFALLGLPSGELKIFLGPFKPVSTPALGHAHLYFNDFFLNKPEPFLSCQAVFSISSSQRKSSFPSSAFNLPEISWDDEPHTQFLESYSFFRHLLDQKKILKAVPIGFSYGKLFSNKLEGKELSSLLYKLYLGQAGLYSYAIKYHGSIILGASPEILCAIDQVNKTISTEAVAGSIIKTHAPLSDITGKLKEEHELVVKDLENQLSAFGEVLKGEISLKNLSSLSHLRTELKVNFLGEIDVHDLITKLHPSGALGILPRVALNHAYLKNLDISNKRSIFGAPFGAVFEDGSTTILVAIRNLIFSGNQVLLGAGAGITKQSEPNSELEEVLAKQRSVKSFFGLL